MTAPALVSVLVPCHDHAAVLPWALASLVAQTHQEWECLVIDDGSADRPRDVVDRFEDPRIRYMRLDRNRGPAAARQLALEHARGDFIAMLDADDWAYPTRFETQLAAFAADPDLAAVGSGMAVVDADNRLLGVRGAVDQEGVSYGMRALPA
ncbi:MAG TPA: glycosyltransferase family 2 protein, partial [Longimicrobiales bacterium]|nr:glycosyltransferase family 2 protein [Longimicrobiales bacterium]